MAQLINQAFTRGCFSDPVVFGAIYGSSDKNGKNGKNDRNGWDSLSESRVRHWYNNNGILSFGWMT